MLAASIVPEGKIVCGEGEVEENSAQRGKGNLCRMMNKRWGGGVYYIVKCVCPVQAPKFLA
jgi:hypothetical protein